jgi:hypothetical protein
MMTKAQMDEAIRNLDRRLVTVEQIVPALATKDDLRQASLETLTGALKDTGAI